MFSSNPIIATLNPLNIAAELGFGAAVEDVKNRGIKLYSKAMFSSVHNSPTNFVSS